MDKIFARVIGMTIIKAAGPYWAAPLHPSVLHVSQKSALSEPIMHASSASGSVCAHDLNTSFVANEQKKRN